MVDKKSALKVGIVGSGFITNEVHLPILTKLANVTVVAVCDKDKARATETAEQFKIGRKYYELSEMLNDNALDIVDICTPPTTHTDLILTALESNCNCMVEKPLTLTVTDADKVIAKAREKKLAVHGLYNYSFLPCVRQAKAIVQSGAIGDLVGVDVKLLVPIEQRHLDPKHWCAQLPGSVLGELAPHMAMLLLDYLSDVKSVKSMVRKMSNYPLITADELRVIVEAKNALGTIILSHNSPPRRLVIDIIATKATLHVDGNSQAIIWYKSIPSSRSVITRGLATLGETFQQVSGLFITTANVALGRYTPLIEGHKYLMKESLKAIRGETSYPLEIERCREAVKLVEMMFSHTL